MVGPIHDQVEIEAVEHRILLKLTKAQDNMCANLNLFIFFLEISPSYRHLVIPSTVTSLYYFKRWGTIKRELLAKPVTVWGKCGYFSRQMAIHQPLYKHSQPIAGLVVIKPETQLPGIPFVKSSQKKSCGWEGNNMYELIKTEWQKKLSQYMTQEVCMYVALSIAVATIN